jgi:hypothetical protein
MKRTAILGLGLILAGCVQAPTGPSPAAIAALPPGIGPEFLVQSGNGCYFIAVEETEPQTGVPLTNASGQQVCDPQ